jgi:hypothetical protein
VGEAVTVTSLYTAGASASSAASCVSRLALCWKEDMEEVEEEGLVEVKKVVVVVVVLAGALVGVEREPVSAAA